jgi:hypothetical protein
MDPYLEQPEVWAEFHNDLAAETQGYLNQRIRPRYIACKAARGSDAAQVNPQVVPQIGQRASLLQHQRCAPQW